MYSRSTGSVCLPVAHHLPARSGRGRPGAGPPARAGGRWRVGPRGRSHRRRDGRMVGGRGRRQGRGSGRHRRSTGAPPEDADDALRVLANLSEAPDVTCENGTERGEDMPHYLLSFSILIMLPFYRETHLLANLGSVDLYLG